MADVVGIGGICVDVFCYVPRVHQTGEAVRGFKYGLGCGGKCTNQVVVVTRLGASAAMIAKVGKDDFGKLCLDALKKNDVNIDYMTQTSEGQTGMAAVAVNTDGDNSIYFMNGTNLLLSVDDVMAAAPLIKEAKVMVCNMEVKQKVTLAALTLAKQHGVTTILTPDVVNTTEKEVDYDLLKFSDIICPNAREVEFLVGLPATDIEKAKVALPVLLDLGPSHVVITLGDSGAVVATREKPEPVHISARKVTAVDTTGAGDALAGSLAFYCAHYRHLSFEERVRRAVYYATTSVEREGTLPSYRPRQDLPAELFS